MNKVTEITINYSPEIKNQDREQITSSKRVYDIAVRDWTEINIRESMKVLFLNRSNKILGIYELSKGGISGTVVDIRLLFATALKALSCAIILLHNHPSGSLEASQSDINVTDKIKDAAKLLDIDLLDHLIISDESYFSFADNGRI